MQTYHMGSQWFSTRGVHELCIQRNHGAVELRRWSRSEGVAKLWATLHFITWEGMPETLSSLPLHSCIGARFRNPPFLFGFYIWPCFCLIKTNHQPLEMVLFYCSFAALKAQNTLTLEVEPDEYILKSERRLFQA